MVSTHLKNISQIGNLPQIGVKIKHIWNHRLLVVANFWRNGCYIGRNPTWESTSKKTCWRFFQWKLWAFSRMNFGVFHWYTTMPAAFILNVNIAYVRCIGGFLGESMQVNTLYIRLLHHLRCFTTFSSSKCPITTKAPSFNTWSFGWSIHESLKSLSLSTPKLVGY